MKTATFAGVVIAFTKTKLQLPRERFAFGIAFVSMTAPLTHKIAEPA